MPAVSWVAPYFASSGIVLGGSKAASARVGERTRLLEEIRRMVSGGLPAVNLCDLDGVAAELFTFEGAGTFFARERYLEVRRLALDEFDAAHDLLQRGVAEGYLAERLSLRLVVVLRWRQPISIRTTSILCSVERRTL